MSDNDKTTVWRSGWLIGVWSPALTPDEVAEISANPWQLFAPPSNCRRMGSPSASTFNPAGASEETTDAPPR